MRASTIIIKNINILDVVNGKIIPNQAILISDGIIQEIGNSFYHAEDTATILDGNGKYAMPGIINMHVHLGDNRDDLLLYLLNGVTTIRNMWGYGNFRIGHYLFGTRVFNHLKLKEQVEKGRLAGPDIYSSGPLLDGKKPFFPKFMYLHALKDKAQVEKVIASQVQKGYDFIKIYSKLSKQNFDDIINTAKQYDIPVAGHVPDAVELNYAITSRMHTMEHLYGFVSPYAPEKNLSDEMIKKAAALAAENHVWICPTLIANERLANINKQSEYENEEQMDYISRKNKKAMRFLIKESYKVFEKAGNTDQEAYMDHLFFIVDQLREAGVKMLLGTDKAVPYVVAGFSEYKEMQLLSQTGLSNAEIIRIATINAAKCLGIDANVGTVETGKKANLILIDKNPLENLQTLSRHAGVIKSGVYYSRKACDGMLLKIKRRAAH